jgi:hypothetical protein
MTESLSTRIFFASKHTLGWTLPVLVYFGVAAKFNASVAAAIAFFAYAVVYSCINIYSDHEYLRSWSGRLIALLLCFASYIPLALEDQTILEKEFFEYLYGVVVCIQIVGFLGLITLFPVRSAGELRS